MWKKLSRLILKLWGWKIIGDYPREAKKFVIAVIPHTSNWDFPLGLLVRSAMDYEVKFIAKDSLFKFPLGPLMFWLDGMPVDRSKSNNFVDAVASMFDSRENFSICIAPEGTRRKVDKLKTGFYYIAVKAKIPISLCAFDWGKHVVTFDTFYPTGDADKDIPAILDHFRGVRGKIPENSIV